MAYEKQNFTDGLTLFASQLNHMEDGIAQNASDIAAKVGIVSVATVVLSTTPGAMNSWRITLTDGTTTDISVRNGTNGANGVAGAGIYLWDSTSEPFGTDGEGNNTYQFSSVTRPDGSNIAHGDLLLDYEGNVYLVEGVGMLVFTPVFQYSLVPSSGGNVDLEGYATEQWVKDQKYLTAVPDGYAKTSDIPTKPEDIGAQPSGNYALKTEIPSVPVQSVNGYAGVVKLTADDVGAISQDKLQEVTNEVLAQAKESGEFDGKDGVDGKDGQDGSPGKEGPAGPSGVYILSDGETLDDVPDEYDVVIDPNGSPDEVLTAGEVTALIDAKLAAIPDASEVAY